MWRSIEEAPKDGTKILAGKMSSFLGGVVLYPLPSRYIGDRWTAEFSRGEWCSYDPQPTHWMPHQ